MLMLCSRKCQSSSTRPSTRTGRPAMHRPVFGGSAGQVAAKIVLADETEVVVFPGGLRVEAPLVAGRLVAECFPPG